MKLFLENDLSLLENIIHQIEVTKLPLEELKIEI